MKEENIMVYFICYLLLTSKIIIRGEKKHAVAFLPVKAPEQLGHERQCCPTTIIEWATIEKLKINKI